MPPIIRQSKVITSLNKYLIKHNLPVRMNRTGICNGLAALYAKYTLEGRQEEFIRIQSRIALLSDETDLDAEVNHFAVEVALSFDPRQFDKEKGQTKGIEFLQIGGKGLKPSFEIGMVNSDANWCSMIRDIALRDDEVMYVRGLDHAISISKKDGKYVLYDPNYDSGYKFFSNEEELVNELHYESFRYTGKSGETPNGIGMNVQVIRHPSKVDNDPGRFPDRDSLYNKYIVPDQTAKVGRHENVDSLYFAILYDDKAAVDTLFRKGLQDMNPMESALLAVAANSTEVLISLIEKIPKPTLEIGKLFEVALKNGHEKSLEKLLENKKCKYWLDRQLSKSETALPLIVYAAGGGNPKVLQRIIEAYSPPNQKIKPNLFGIKECVDKIFKTFPQLIQCAPLDGVKLVCEQLENANTQFDAKRLLTYLHKAIQSNRPDMVDFFIAKIHARFAADPETKKNIFQSISMSLGLVDQTDISILNKLKTCGVQFSEYAEGVIAEKENRPIAGALSVGISLYRFTDFIKALVSTFVPDCIKKKLLPNDDVDNSVKKFTDLKGRMQQTINTLEPGNTASESENDNYSANENTGLDLGS